MKADTQIGIVIALFALVLLPGALAHGAAPGDHSVEEIVVRVADADLSTHTYTFTCDVPTNSVWDQPTWSIRTTKDAHTVLEVKDDSTFVYSFDNDLPTGVSPQDLFHVACQMGVDDGGVERVARGDFHLDLRSESERQSAYPDTPNLYISSADGLSFTAQCIPKQGTNPSSVGWKIMFAHGAGMEEFTGPLTITETVAEPGLWDIECSQDGDFWPVPVEFFSSGPAYIPSETGCVAGEHCWTEGSDGSDDNSTDDDDNSTGDDDNSTSEPSGDTCHSSVQNIPVTCTGGTIQSDEWNGCRTVLCTNGGNSVQAMACDKGSTFEAYRHATTGANPGIEVCFGDACVGNAGFDSSALPYCVESDDGSSDNETDSSGNETDDGSGDDNETDGGSGEEVCHDTIAAIPVTCGGGAVTSDNFNGCRTVVCGGTQAKACPKGDGFEVYRQIGGGDVCFGDTCLGNSGFARGDLPFCTEGDGSVDDGSGDDNQTDDGSSDEPGETCYEDVQALPATCEGGTITSDTFNGCRSVSCSGSSGSLTVLACDKPAPDRVEVYRKSGSGVTICLGDACISDNGYDASAYPICVADDGSSDDGSSDDGDNSTGGDENTTIPAPDWLEPTNGRMDVNPFDLHMHLFDMPGDGWVSSDFEVWDPALDSIVWSYYGAEANHVHFGDGVWADPSEMNLMYDTEYFVRARYDTTNGSGPWSQRAFSTEMQPTGGDDPSDWSWTPADGHKVELVASGLSFPVNIEDAPELYTHLPHDDQPLLYVTHLYGQLGMVTKGGDYVEFADGLLNYQAFGSLPGSGEMGVTGLYVDSVTGDVYASMVYHVGGDEFKGKVVRFFTNDDGDGHTGTDIVIDDVPSSPSHQIQDITRGPDGRLYVSTGDANMLSTTKDPSTWNGKVLRIDESTGSVEVYAAGFRNPFGTAWRPGTNELFAGNNGPDSDDGIYRMTGAGQTFGWCCNTATGTWRHYPQTVVPTAVDFKDGDGNNLYIVLAGSTNSPGPSERGKRVMRIGIDGDGTPGTEQVMVRYTGDGFGSPNGLSFIDGTLHFTDLLGETGEAGNIYRLVPGEQTQDPAPGGAFSATMAPKPWYPQGRTVVWECRAVEGSGDYKYDYRFGDGNGVFGTTRSDVYYTYSADGTYDASCTAYDQQTGQSATDSITLTIGEDREGTGDGGDDGGDTGGSQTCHESVESIPVSCGGASVTSDVYTGCRTIGCSDGTQAKACPKDGGFEVYRQAGSGDVCFGDTCLGANGFDRGSLPYCA